MKTLTTCLMAIVLTFGCVPSHANEAMAAKAIAANIGQKLTLPNVALIAILISFGMKEQDKALIADERLYVQCAADMQRWDQALSHDNVMACHNYRLMVRVDALTGRTQW